MRLKQINDNANGCEHNYILLTMIMIYTLKNVIKTCSKGRDNVVKSSLQMQKYNNCDTRFEMTTLSFNLKDYIQTII